jgi:hypothetical protein
MNLCGWSGRYYVMKIFDEGEGEDWEVWERGTSEVAYLLSLVLVISAAS